MQGPKLIRYVRDVILLAALALGTAASADPAEPFEVMMHGDDVYGARDIEAGNYARGVERLESRLGGSLQAYSSRTPIIIDLCAGYTMLEQFEEATRFCDEAVENGWSAGLALNNRGALHVAKGDYELAIRDFQAALRANGADAIARRNLERVQVRIAELRKPQDAAMANVAESTQ